MKKILLTLFLGSVLLFAELKTAKSFEEARQTASQENKIVMLMYIQQGCGACEYMTDVVFENPEVQAELNLHFVPLIIDIHKEKPMEGLRVYGTPTFYFFDKNGQRIGRQLVGSMTAETFLQQLKRVRK